MGLNRYLAIHYKVGGAQARPIKVWKVKPNLCLIRWDFIITSQYLEEEITDTNTIGFKPK